MKLGRYGNIWNVASKSVRSMEAECGNRGHAMTDFSNDDFIRSIARARSGLMTDSEIADLAIGLSRSGKRLCLSGATADLVAIGGAGSLSMLWGPAALVASGFSVPKLGVRGDLAGGIDVLAQIPGYRIDFDEREAKGIVEQCGYAHFLPGLHFAPAEGEMFNYRQHSRAAKIPALTIASLLSKLLAAGVARVGLEVQVSADGDFGTGLSEAKANADRFVHVAQRLGLKAICFLIDGSLPPQPYFGRGEALLGLLRLFGSDADPWLERHVRACEAWASVMVGSSCRSRLAIAHAFAANVIAQGGTIDGLEERATRVAASHASIVEATAQGVVTYDLGKMRDAIATCRQPDVDAYFDDSVGLILLASPGSVVRAGEPLVSVRCPKEVWPAMNAAVLSAVRLSGNDESVRPAALVGTLDVVGTTDRN